MSTSDYRMERNSTKEDQDQDAAMDMSVLIHLQEEARRQIRKILSNAKATPIARRTSEALHRVSNAMETRWGEFVTRDTDLQKFAAVEHHVYTTEQWYQAVEQDVLALRKWIAEKMPKEDAGPEVQAKITMRSVFRKLLTGKVGQSQSDLDVVGAECESETVVKYLTSFVAIHHETMAIMGDGDRKREMETEAEAIIESAEKYLLALQTPSAHSPIIALPQAPAAPRATEPTPLTLEAVVAALSGVNDRSKSSLQLPRMELPKFAGESADWRDYKERFLAMVDQNPRLSAIEKMHYLKESLSGDALETLRDLSLTQYSEGWEALVSRYHNPKVRMFEVLRSMLSLPAATERSVEIRRLVDGIKTARFNLADLGVNVAEWNALFVFLACQRLPKATFEAWEESCAVKREVAPFAEMESFLENRTHTLAAIEGRTLTVAKVNAAIAQPKPTATTAAERTCTICQGHHWNYKCPKFTAVSAPERKVMAKNLKLCFRCLNEHKVESCPYEFKCRICDGAHNTALHVEPLRANFCQAGSAVILATATLNVTGPTGRKMSLRVLFDQGSQVSLISEKVVQQLLLPRHHSSMIIEVVGGSEIPQRGGTVVTFNSLVDNDTQFEVPAIILKKILTVLPENYCPLPDELKHLELADPKYWKGGSVDLVLGADVFPKLLLPGVINAGLLAQRTHLGWIISGAVGGPISSAKSCSVTCDNLESLIKRFFESEDKVVEVPPWTDEQREAEEFYCATTIRREDGRYEVRLPFKKDVALGNSRGAAVGQMIQLEKRFKSNPQFFARYSMAVQEYFDKGHAVVCAAPRSAAHCYLPHLAVIKDTSLTTKTRIVFNASSPTANRRSLNDNLLVGPVVQRDLVGKVLRVRMRLFVCVCDIEQMYKQIGMCVDDQEFQRFVWRNDESEPFLECKLTTVTFGESSAPFTATRTLVKLATDSSESHPKASAIILHDSYVDDIHHSEDSEEELLAATDELIDLLASAGFALRKFSTNSDLLRNSLSSDSRNDEQMVSFIGLEWNRVTDEFSYPRVQFTRKTTMTKREILSEISQLFDPLGWVQPLVAPAKFLMQEVTRMVKAWNDPVPEEIIHRWQAIATSWENLDNVRIPRFMNYSETEPMFLHAFCDASEKGFGAVLYLVTPLGVRLVLAKGKVAPESTVTIPRLELKGAVVAVELVERFLEAMGGKRTNLTIVGWCDSQVVLKWIEGDLSKWKPFVRNRTAMIRETLPPSNWNYVPSEDNPADQISRGTDIFLWDTAQWFSGPAWLEFWRPAERIFTSPVANLEDEQAISEEAVKGRGVVAGVIVAEPSNLFKSLIDKFSSFSRCARILAWVMRFTQNCRKGIINKTEPWITVSEIATAKMKLIQEVQEQLFPDELQRLREKKPIKQSSKIRALSPFLDQFGTLRMMGRLANSNYPAEMRHPIILGQHTLTTAIVVETHQACLHGGLSATLGNLRKKFWVIRGTQVVKKILRSCVICARSRPRLLQQLMADLPLERVTWTKPFLNSGVDFAGPFTLKGEVGRGSRQYKAYVAVFVCLATKAIHLEVVCSLTTDSFIAALRRFVARRGPVEKLYSDNGTNFVGAFRRLQSIQERMAEQSLEWAFIPPAAPHFGGLWEAGVKSMKTHLSRTLKDAKLSLEEMSTILAQIEAALNSRPLGPLTDDVNDLEALTPGHFLTGQQYVPVPDEPEEWSLARRFATVQSLFHAVVQRYKTEYVTRLNQRPKWLKRERNVEPGELVLLVDDTMCSKTWRLGRILKTHPGADGLTRVVTIQTIEGTKLRPIHKIAPLPVRASEPPTACRSSCV